MIANITKMLDEVHRIYEPGMERFFGSPNPDMWTRSIDELEGSILNSSKEVVTRAIAIYKYRRMKMVEIFRSFKELAQLEVGNNPVIDAIQKNLYADSSEQTTRRLVRCDQCQNTPEISGAIQLTATEEMNNQGDPYVWIGAICRACHRERGVA
jgi:hypothetical protein